MHGITEERLTVTDRYELVRELGRGGTSIVYLVKDRKDDKKYAMKLLKKDTDSIAEEELLRRSEQLRAEAAVLQSLGGEHRGIPAYRGEIRGEDGFFTGFLMDYVEGRPLQELLEEGQTYSVREAAEVGLQLCGILRQLHRRDPPMIYRDLKPANILVRADGSVTLVDFGAVRKYREDAGKDTNHLGTEGYAAPEQYGGWEQSDTRTDIYGVGAVLHHMITGRPPLETGLRPLTELHLPLHIGGGASQMTSILLRCCSVAPSMRFSSCGELEKALRGVIRACGKEEAGILTEFPGDRPWKRFVLLICAAAVFFMCAGMLAASSADAGRKEYGERIEEAEKIRDLEEKTDAYLRAVSVRPDDPQAYLCFLRELAEDGVITQEEKTAWDRVANADDGPERMREKKTRAYARLQMEMGKAFFCCYEAGTEPARAAFEKVRETAGLWSEGREIAETMDVILGEVWSKERMDAFRTLERAAIREAHKSGDGIFAATVCKAAAAEIALFEERYEEAGTDPERIREVTENAVEFMSEADNGRPRVPSGLLEELHTAVEAALRRVND